MELNTVYTEALSLLASQAIGNGAIIDNPAAEQLRQKELGKAVKLLEKAIDKALEFDRMNEAK